MKKINKNVGNIG